MNKPLLSTVAGLASLAAGLAGAQTYSTYPTYGYGNYDGQPRVVRCESTGSRRNFCRVDTRGGVQLSRQLSRTACVRGRTWQASRDGISVAGGCRAEFVVNAGYDNRYGSYNGAYRTDRYGSRDYEDRVAQPGYYGDSRTIHCQGTGHGRTYCGVRGSHYTMIDRSPSCLVNRTFGDDAYGTWVSGNCNADFILASYPVDQSYGYGYTDPADDVYNRNRDLGPYGTPQGYRDPGTYPMPTTYGSDVIHCQAANYGRTYCGDRTRSYSLQYGVNGGANCVLGETYGRDSYGTWVSGNCDLILDPRQY
jgi:hypothetical protein